MPKIVRLHAFGSVENLKIDELPSQPLKADEARIKIQAACISRDNFMLINAHDFSAYGFPVPELPSKLCYEASGIVTEVGEEVDGSWVGKKVAPNLFIDEIKYGMLGEEAVIPASFLCEYPHNLSPQEAAAFWVPYLTAYGGLKSVATVKKGDYIAITAGASSVGLAAIQIARDLGAIPIAVIRSSAKKEKLLELGAAHVIATKEENYAERIIEITSGNGIQLTFDPIGGSILKDLIAGAAQRGTIIQYGVLGNEPVTFPLPEIIAKDLTIKGYSVGGGLLFDNAKAAEARRYILEGLSNGTFVPRVAKVFPLENITDAYSYLNSSEQLGRIVISTE
ncbi:MAG: zinc-dependent alcohol dehydrogenase family protein [Bacteroidetes bacterium]|nr:zinc-dependent alcohol dehydrogenase family protein [Bacteroidota bacterium]